MVSAFMMTSEEMTPQPTAARQPQRRRSVLAIALALSLAVNLVGAVIGWRYFQLYGQQAVQKLKLMWVWTPTTRQRATGITGIYRNYRYLARTAQFAGYTLTPEALVFVGDSITAQCEWAELLGTPHAVNRGISGDTTEGVLNRLAPLLQTPPRRLFLQVGINDLAYGVPPAQVAAHYRLILARARQALPGERIIVQSLLPTNPRLMAPHLPHRRILLATVRSLNAEVRELCRAQGARFLDIATPLSGADGLLDPRYTHDGLHLNGAGYRRWRQTLIAAGVGGPAPAATPPSASPPPASRPR
jgi:lysophospholipase L1-like esterase